MRFARLPEPPYWSVIFASQSKAEDAGYVETAKRMLALAAAQPGFLGVESTRDAEGFGITVSYWDSLEAIDRWRRDVEHAAARAMGRERWYVAFRVRVARVERAYGFGPGHA